MKLIFFIALMTFNSWIMASSLRLLPEEKENIKKAVKSGTTFYAMKENSIMYDLIEDKEVYLHEPIIAEFFNEPTLSGHRYMATNGKVRFIVDTKYLNEATQVLEMRPVPKRFIPTDGSIPNIPVGAPHEVKK